MFKKIISFIAAAACTASIAQTAFAWDGSIKPVVDTGGAVQIYSVSEQDEDDPNVSRFFYCDKDGNHLNGLVYGDFADENELAPKLLMADFDDGKANFVYGFTKNSKGKRYYTRGERAYGWKKIGGYWYHFDVKSGYMDTGRTKICGAVYTFDEKGRWQNRVSKSGLAPEDFSLRVTGAIRNGFDTSEKKLYYGWAGGSVAEANVKISPRDRQILWCMFLESGFELGGKESFDWKYMDNFCEETLPKDSGYSLYGSDPEVVHTITVTAGGKTATVKYNTDAAQIALLDEKAYHAQLLENQYWAYFRELEEKYPYSGEEEIDYLD